MHKSQLRSVSLAASLAALLMSSPASASRRYGVAGCGLGSVFFGTGGPQSSAASTNASSGNQTFAISSGSSNCQAGGKNGAGIEQEDFFVANYASLSKEAAQGSGETLTGFAGVLGCPADRTPVVAARLQADYGEIFAKPGAVAAYDAALDSLRGEPQVAANCQYL